MSSDIMQHELVERARQTNVLTKRDITKAWFIYWLGAEVSNSYERLQSLIFCASMTPIIKKLYPQKEEQVEALKRHLNFFNSEQTFGAVIQGVAIAMEEQKTRGEPISDSSITGIKTGLMGPLAGIGDSVVWAAIMPLLIAIFIPFAANGSAMGGIMPVVLYTVITMAISYGLAHKGYTLGRESIIGLLQGGKIKELIYGANVLGLIMMGVAVCQLRQDHLAVENQRVGRFRGGGATDPGFHRPRPVAAGCGVLDLLLSGQKRAALYHHSAFGSGTERGVFPVGYFVTEQR